MRPRKLLTFVFIALLLSIGYLSMNAAPVLSDENFSYHGDTAWRTDFSEAKEIANEQHTPIVLYFWTTWCTYCEDYNENVYPNETVQNRLDDFVKVAVNLDGDSSLQQRYNVNFPPQHVIITPDGEELVRITGYADREDFLSYLETANKRANGTESA
ncbi:hypothetical protein C448_05763 [Halococcus morrhuae DSM 1307]|uniref:Thioredoxin domain-containing protein n=1 Tax=Halococcus morrhuae DSM 1307 TaxID=931277 RepID=M0MQ54_HALMO|nr:thioredoxin family protein [Halococcus morrhuae]EMA46874.1 hypothetical protein C448_05763 [Halococcus morrhuae DSM 1307]